VALRKNTGMDAHGSAEREAPAEALTDLSRFFSLNLCVLRRSRRGGAERCRSVADFYRKYSLETVERGRMGFISCVLK
jgi:hypothetical protein